MMRGKQKRRNDEASRSKAEIKNGWSSLTNQDSHLSTEFPNSIRRKWIFPGTTIYFFLFYKYIRPAPLIARECVFRSHWSSQEGRMTLFCRAKNYLLVSYPNDFNITENVVIMLIFSKIASHRAVEYVQSLGTKRFCCWTIYYHFSLQDRLLRDWGKSNLMEKGLEVILLKQVCCALRNDTWSTSYPYFNVGNRYTVLISMIKKKTKNRVHCHACNFMEVKLPRSCRYWLTEWANENLGRSIFWIYRRDWGRHSTSHRQTLHRLQQWTILVSV